MCYATVRVEFTKEKLRDLKRPLTFVSSASLSEQLATNTGEPPLSQRQATGEKAKSFYDQDQSCAAKMLFEDKRTPRMIFSVTARALIKIFTATAMIMPISR
jgi:hypothetical protein